LLRAAPVLHVSLRERYMLKNIWLQPPQPQLKKDSA
jgi:hypothetical protein